jgi:superfamily I DNA/RNA helicase
MAVLYRAHYQGTRIEEALRAAAIPVEAFSRDWTTRRYNPGAESVKLMTMHSSKGLEFPVVFLPCLHAMPTASADVADEAKLLYVAMTRAMERLVLTHHADSLFVRRLTESVTRVRGRDSDSSGGRLPTNSKKWLRGLFSRPPTGVDRNLR